jgi:AAA15 family ATPase/GTPase
MGTKSLYNLLALYKLALDHGGLLLIDEFDINLHPDILPHLVKLFESQETNPKNAQLIFATQNSDILDYMTKHRTYLFNKVENESFCYRLDELDHNLVRSDRPISPLYRAGRIGGVPRI